MTTTRPRGHPPHRRTRTTPPATLPTAPSPAAMAEAVAMLSGRIYGAANLPLSGDVPAADIIRALLGLTVALLDDAFPDDRGAALLRLLGATVAGHTGT